MPIEKSLHWLFPWKVEVPACQARSYTETNWVMWPWREIKKWAETVSLRKCSK
jgi:hypothetical protein